MKLLAAKLFTAKAITIAVASTAGVAGATAGVVKVTRPTEVARIAQVENEPSAEPSTSPATPEPTLAPTPEPEPVHFEVLGMVTAATVRELASRHELGYPDQPGSLQLVVKARSSMLEACGVEPGAAVAVHWTRETTFDPKKAAADPNFPANLVGRKVNAGGLLDGCAMVARGIRVSQLPVQTTKPKPEPTRKPEPTAKTCPQTDSGCQPKTCPQTSVGCGPTPTPKAGCLAVLHSESECPQPSPTPTFCPQTYGSCPSPSPGTD